MKACPFSFNKDPTIYCHEGHPFINREVPGDRECMAWCSIPGYCKLIGRDE